MILSWTAPPSGQARVSARSLSSGTSRARGFRSIGADGCESEQHEACRASGTRIIAFGLGALRAPWILVPHYARSSGKGPGFSVGGLALDRLLVDHASGLHFELLLDPAVRSRRRRVVKGSGDLR